MSGHYGKPINHRLGEAKREEIVEFIAAPVIEGFGPTVLKEKLEEYKRVMISKKTMRQIMIEEGKHHPLREC